MSAWWLLLIIPATIVVTIVSVAVWFGRSFMKGW